ncbi:MAG: H-NS histone family protein [Gammaproteobacteria bacterium]|jgi:DNA-binding protein H-NS|nr:H-NS histone family protein [Gammaproteobacteria bacterium]
MKNYEELSAAELKAELEEMAAKEQALKRALEARREQEKYELANEIKTMIKERGHDIEEVTDLVFGRKRRSGASGGSNASYARYADPKNPNNTYLRGRLPNWLVEKMSANGYDPNSAEQRAQFKEEHLVRITG